MKSKLYKKVEQFVVDSYTAAKDLRGLTHLLRTVYWLHQLKPDADDALCIAAVAHDIERTYRDEGESILEIIRKKGFIDEGILNRHQNKSAKIICEFLKEKGANDDFIERVKGLVEKHEVGGTDDQNLIKDADSISYFENNAIYFVDVKLKEVGAPHVKEKLDWMFNRMSFDRAKQISREWYQNANARLINEQEI